MNIEKIKKAFYTSALILVLGVILMVVLDHIFPVLLPFMISYAIACLTTAPAIKIEQRTGASRRKLRLFISLFSLLVLSLLIFFIGRYSLITVWEIAKNLLEGDKISGLISGVLDPMESIFGSSLPDEIKSQLTDAARAFFSKIISALGSLVSSAAVFLPKLFLFLVVTLISLVYFSLDLEDLNAKIKSVLPESFGKKLTSARERILSVGVRYVFSYLSIMGITFSVMLVGFFILKVAHPFLLALLIAFFDLFPIIGVGTVVIPWAIIELILGNTGRGIGLLVLFVVNELIRQFAEPKILGKSLDIHPIITLVLIYAAIALFGLKGLLLIPILVALIGAVDMKNILK